jgi:hypothetical protein
MALGLLGIVKRLGYHPATPTTVPIFEENRHLFIELSLYVDETLPESREKSLCLTSLQAGLMWANAAVAIHLSPTETALPPQMPPGHGEQLDLPPGAVGD